MQFVEQHGVQAGEQVARVRMAQHQRELFWRGQQNVGRLEALALADGRRGVAGAEFDLDIEAHLADGRDQVAADVGCERLERRNVECVQCPRGTAFSAVTAGLKIDQRRQEACQGFTSACGGDQQCGPALL